MIKIVKIHPRMHAINSNSPCFQWVGQPSKFPISLPGPHLINGSLGPPESAPKWHLDQFSRFLQGSQTCPIHKLTERPCHAVCSNGLLSPAISAMPSNNIILILTNNNNTYAKLIHTSFCCLNLFITCPVPQSMRQTVSPPQVATTPVSLATLCT